MDPNILRNWKIFSSSSAHEVDLEDLSSVHIFDTEGDGEQQGELGAVLITRAESGSQPAGDIFYCLGPAHKWFLADEPEEDKAKVDYLSDWGLSKFKVGGNICAGINLCHDLVYWNGPSKIPRTAFIWFELYDGSTCMSCEESCYTMAQIYNLNLNYCDTCEWYSTLENYSSNAVKLVKFNEAKINCNKCNRICTSRKIVEWDINFCASCNIFPQDAVYVNQHPGKHKQSVKLGEGVKTVDLECGSKFVIGLTDKNYLVLYGTIQDSEYNGVIVQNPAHGAVKTFRCGGNHVAVMTVGGDLYTCGLGDKGQLGYEWTPAMGHTILRKVPLEGKVAKVCCGFSTTTCLMTDGSLMCFGSHMKMLSPGVLAVNQRKTHFTSEPTKILGNVKFTDVANSPQTNVFVAKTGGMTVKWGINSASSQPELVNWYHHIYGTEMMGALADLPASFTFKTQSSQHSTPDPHLNSELYGKKYLSDITLELSDEDFPAHRLILASNSFYFRDTFRQDDSASRLDMSCYNPEAYRCLLKYFYDTTPNELNASDLFDLYMLATSYKETDIAMDVFEKLKISLTPQTVLLLLRKAKEVNCTEFLEECNSFLSSPEFKDNLADRVLQDVDKAMSVLEVLDEA